MDGAYARVCGYGEMGVRDRVSCAEILHRKMCIRDRYGGIYCHLLPVLLLVQDVTQYHFFVGINPGVGYDD